MISARFAAVLATGSVSLGYIIGTRQSYLKNNGHNHSSEQWSYVFPPPLQAKSSTSFPSSSNTDLQQISAPQKVASSVGTMVKYGFPSTDDLRSYDDFILSYDKRNRNANWVIEHLTKEKVTKTDGVERVNAKFIEDESVHNFHRATNKDYMGSGYDRGHLAAAANHRQSETAMNQTFLLSNISPQVGEGFNRDAWNNLEKYIRALVRKNKSVHVCTGPLYLPRYEPDGKLYVKYEVIGQNHVAVPTHFFKVAVIEKDNGELELKSFVMPNQKLPAVKLQKYLVPLETIERASGLSFFKNIPRTAFKKINVSLSSV